MRIQLTKPIGALLTAGLFTLPNYLQAQATAHYPPGLEGLKAASLPPPGVYLRDYNLFYYADHRNDAQGNKASNPTGQIDPAYEIPRVENGEEHWRDDGY